MTNAPPDSRPVAVYGAGGHTGRFVVAEALRRGLPVVAVGRDASRLPPGVPAREAAIDDPAALDRAFAGCAVVIHCAGPFLDTARPVVEAALRAGAHYLDVTAEQGSAFDTFERFDARARAAGLAVIPAAGFYGGLADLLVTALAGDDGAEDIEVAVALDHWWPTRGTRETGHRNQLPRQVVREGRLEAMSQPAATAYWRFGAPHGDQRVVELPFSEVATLTRHLHPRSLRSWLTQRSLDQIRDAATPPPAAVDARGRSAQRFEMAVRVGTAAGPRRASASGQDIYAVSAPLLVEAAARLREGGPAVAGAVSLAQAFDARGFLAALAPEPLAIEGLATD